MKDTVRIHISLPLELKLQLRSMAGSYDMSLNVLINRALWHLAHGDFTIAEPKEKED